MAYQALEKLHRLHDGYRQVVRVGNRELLLIQERGRVHVVENRCPHMDAPLHFGDINRGFIRCPLHGIEFDLSSGEAKPPSCLKPLRIYTPVYEGNTIGIDVISE